MVHDTTRPFSGLSSSTRGVRTYKQRVNNSICLTPQHAAVRQILTVTDHRERQRERERERELVNL